jgi:predicted nucleic acid-binding protein
LIAPDTSVVVAAFVSWHEGHRAALAALSRGSRLPAHVATETYSVLTRLPRPHRVTAEVVVGYLTERFNDSWLTLSQNEQSALLREASSKGITGGAVYDALIAVTARHAGATVLTRDHRATRVYVALDVPFRFVS